MAKFLVLILCLVLTNLHEIVATSEAPKAAPRKLGKQAVANKSSFSRLSSAEAPRADLKSSGGTVPAEVSASGEETAPVGLGQQEEMKTNNHHRRSVDKSVAGGGVIVGGLATTFLVAIFCYIRATRRRAAEPASPTNLSPSLGQERRNGELGLSV